MSSGEADSLLKSLPRGKVSLVLLPSSLVEEDDVDDLALSTTSSGLGESISTMAKSLSNSSVSSAPVNDPEEGVIQFEVR